MAEVRPWRGSLAAEEDEEALARLRRHCRTGRPLCVPALPGQLESLLGRKAQNV